MNEQGRFTSYGIFLNDNGNRYVLYNVDFLSCLEIECGPFNHPIDINNDGKYEILNILHSTQGIANIDITMLDYNFIIGSPTFDIEYTDQMMNEDEFFETIDSFRPPHLWKKNNGKQAIHIPTNSSHTKMFTSSSFPITFS